MAVLHIQLHVVTTIGSMYTGSSCFAIHYSVLNYQMDFKFPVSIWFDMRLYMSKFLPHAMYHYSVPTS